MSKRFAVIGGSCVDIFATSTLPVVLHDSNPGKVNIGFGGVGRNIAENLARLNQQVQLIAAFGSDPFSSEMLAHTSAAGVETSYCIVSKTHTTSFYISINEPSGDMHTAVNDMEICREITPDYLYEKLNSINQSDAVILDTNITKEAIDFLAEHCKPPLFADAVSMKKVLKLSDALPHLFALNCNRHEAQALLKTEIETDIVSLKHAASRFHELGIQYVLITLGAQGAFLSDGLKGLLMNAFNVQTINANGCGDAFSAAAFLGILRDDDSSVILVNALAAAAITAQCAQSVSRNISSDTIRALIMKSREFL